MRVLLAGFWIRTTEIMINTYILEVNKHCLGHVISQSVLFSRLEIMNRCDLSGHDSVRVLEIPIVSWSHYDHRLCECFVGWHLRTALIVLLARVERFRIACIVSVTTLGIRC